MITIFSSLLLYLYIVILGEGGQGSVLLRGLLPRWLAAHVRLKVLDHDHHENHDDGGQHNYHDDHDKQI